MAVGDRSSPTPKVEGVSGYEADWGDAHDAAASF
jgi:hypothetical protein